MKNPGWDSVPEDKKPALEEVMHMLEHIKMRFVLVVYASDGVGAVLSDVHPSQAIGSLEQVLAAAKAGVGFDRIADKKRPQ